MIKTLLKPQWPSSQDPRSVDLAGVRRIVFSPSVKTLNFDFTGTWADKADHTPRSSPSYFTASKAPVSRDLLVTLFSGNSSGYLGSPSPALSELLNSLEFQFADGSYLSLSEISRRTALPSFLNPCFYLQDRGCQWSEALEDSDEWMRPFRLAPHLQRNTDLRRTWIIVLEILHWSLLRQSNTGDLEVALSLSGEQSQAPLREIEFCDGLRLRATVTADHETTNLAHICIWQGFETDAPSGRLRLASTTLLTELHNYLLASPARSHKNSEQERALIANEKNLKWIPAAIATETNPQTFLKSLAKLELAIGEEEIFFLNRQQVTGPAFKPRLQVRESENALQAAVSFDIQAQRLVHLDLPFYLGSALKPFFGGIDAFLGVDRKDEASAKKALRANDLLFLRHQGVALFCLFELINWMTQGRFSTGEEIHFTTDRDLLAADRELNAMIQYLEKSIPALLGKTNLSFHALISPKVQNHFLDFIEQLYQSLIQDRFFVFHAGQVIEIRQLHAQVLPLIRFLFLHFIEISDGKFLTRTEAPLGESFLRTLAAWTGPRVVTNDLALRGAEPRWIDLGIFNKYSVSLLFELSHQGFDVELDGSPLASHEMPFDFSFSVHETQIDDDSNWFDLHPRVFFNGTPVSPEEVRLNFGQGEVGFLEYQGRIYRVDKQLFPSLKSLQKFWDKLKGYRPVQDRQNSNQEPYRLQRSQALDLLMLKSQGFKIQAEGQWKKVFDYFETGLGVEKIDLPEGMRDRLLPHQIESAQWLHDLHELKLGAILADEMGLGKTFQVLAFLSSLKQRDLLQKSLIIVPTSLVYNWLDEKNKFANDLPMRIFRSQDKGDVEEQLKISAPLVLVATYGLLSENLDFFGAHEWNVLAFDEAQNLKNPVSQRSLAARELRSQFKICITGTPMENNYLELFSICDLVVPGAVGDIDSFRKQYVNHEARTESIQNLRLLTKPLILRRTKQEIKLALPAKTSYSIRLPFDEKQKDVYKKMAMTFSRQVEDLLENQDERRAQFAMLAALMRLRQICSDPAAVPGVVYPETPVKVEHLLRSIQEHIENQESVVVFTQFLSTLNRVESELRKRQIPTFILHGGVSAKERIRLISAFQADPRAGVMLMTLKTGGVGLNLTKASVVYHLEPWWNPAVENQATDRAHRLGQTKDVTVYNLLIEGSLEERIAELKLKKQNAFDRFFAIDENSDADASVLKGSSALSREDFAYLLK